ncbi:MAG: D-alanine--D-alanine ligase [bacterium]
MKIAVLCGGISCERNVSYAGGKAVTEALQLKGHEAIPIDPAFGDDLEKQNQLKHILNDISKYPTLEELHQYSTKKIIDCINSSLFDDIECAFIVLHGPNGEDGLVQALLELRKIPYTGSGVRASSTAINKAATKIMMEAGGIMTPPWTIVHKDQLDDLTLFEEIRSYLGENMIVKPSNQGSTFGITHLESGILDEMQEAAQKAAEYSNTILFEKFIEGREITVAIIGGKAYPIVEIIPEGGFYDYDAKYVGGGTVYECPADIDENVAEFTQEQALHLNNLLGCQGFTRADFRLDEDLQAYCLEINTIPGFTSRSLVPMAAKEEGIEFPELCQMIIDIAMKR